MSQPVPRTRTQQPKRTVSIIGTGSYLPERVLSNHDLEKLVETSDEWIVTRTGIKERRIAAQHQATSDLAANAARVAMERARILSRSMPSIAPIRAERTTCGSMASSPCSASCTRIASMR